MAYYRILLCGPLTLAHHKMRNLILPVVTLACLPSDIFAVLPGATLSSPLYSGYNNGNYGDFQPKRSYVIYDGDVSNLPNAQERPQVLSSTRPWHIEFNQRNPQQQRYQQPSYIPQASRQSPTVAYHAVYSNLIQVYDDPSHQRKYYGPYDSKSYREPNKGFYNYPILRPRPVEVPKFDVIYPFENQRKNYYKNENLPDTFPTPFSPNKNFEFKDPENFRGPRPDGFYRTHTVFYNSNNNDNNINSNNNNNEEVASRRDNCNYIRLNEKGFPTRNELCGRSISDILLAPDYSITGDLILEHRKKYRGSERSNSIVSNEIVKQVYRRKKRDVQDLPMLALPNPLVEEGKRREERSPKKLMASSIEEVQPWRSNTGQDSYKSVLGDEGYRRVKRQALRSPKKLMSWSIEEVPKRRRSAGQDSYEPALVKEGHRREKRHKAPGNPTNFMVSSDGSVKEITLRKKREAQFFGRNSGGYYGGSSSGGYFGGTSDYGGSSCCGSSGYGYNPYQNRYNSEMGYESTRYVHRPYESNAGSRGGGYGYRGGQNYYNDNNSNGDDGEESSSRTRGLTSYTSNKGHGNNQGRYRDDRDEASESEEENNNSENRGNKTSTNNNKSWRQGSSSSDKSNSKGRKSNSWRGSNQNSNNNNDREESSESRGGWQRQGQDYNSRGGGGSSFMRNGGSRYNFNNGGSSRYDNIGGGQFGGSSGYGGGYGRGSSSPFGGFG